MRWRALRVSLLIFQAVWLNVIVPGHTRGVVSLPGSACESCNQPLLQSCAADAPNSTRKRKPIRDPASHCAICNFAARLTLPPVIDFTPPRLGLAEILGPPAPQAFDSFRLALPYEGRAPPTQV